MAVVIVATMVPVMVVSIIATCGTTAPLLRSTRVIAVGVTVTAVPPRHATSLRIVSITITITSNTV